MKKFLYGAKVSIVTVLVMCFILTVYTLFYNGAAEVRIKSGEEGNRVVMLQERELTGS